MPTVYFADKNSKIEVAVGTDCQNIDHFRFGCRNCQCGTCAIHVVAGMENLTKMSEAEKKLLEKLRLDPSIHRLACQCAIGGDITIETNRVVEGSPREKVDGRSVS